MNPEERLRSIYSILEELREKAEEGWVILVEGERDIKTLRDLNVDGMIIAIGQMRDSDVVDRYAGCSGVIIMTDWDRRGHIMERNMVKKFSSWGIIPETGIKKRLGGLVSGEIHRIEDLRKFISNLLNELEDAKRGYNHER